MRSKMLRDAFWDAVYDIASKNKDVVLVSADFGAPSLDKFRMELGTQYIDVGIAEQNAVTLSAGLALSGKKVFTYAIAPFIALRCYEQTRINLSSMKVPVSLVGVGAGVSYEDSGPTHHAVDDISILRILPNFKIFNASDAVMAEGFAKLSCEIDYPNYVRLDRQQLPDLYEEGTDFSAGIALLKPGKDVCLAATGNMVHRALEISDSLKEKGIDASVLDIYMLPIAAEPFIEYVQGIKKIYSLEEHNLVGGVGSAVCEMVCDNGLPIPVKRFAMNFQKGYCYKYGGREYLQSLYELDKEKVMETILKDW